MGQMTETTTSPIGVEKDPHLRVETRSLLVIRGSRTSGSDRRPLARMVFRNELTDDSKIVSIAIKAIKHELQP
jgi:hypothetical protein